MYQTMLLNVYPVVSLGQQKKFGKNELSEKNIFLLMAD